MKNTISKFTFLAGIMIFANSCSAPEERAIDVVNSDSTTMTSPSDSNNLYDSSGTDSIPGNGDSGTRNTKVETFKHTPIDTITSLQDSNKKQE